MTITEKVAYIKGLADGLELDANNKQDKLIKAIIDILEDVALSVEDLEDGCAELCEQIDAIDEDLSALEDDIYEEDDECECDDDEDDEDYYEMECPSCHDIIYIDEDMLQEKGIECPNCGTDLEFDFDCDCEDEGCTCHDGKEDKEDKENK